MVTYSKEEKQAIMEEYKTSGKSLREYISESNMQFVGFCRFSILRAVCAGSHPAANPHDYWLFCLFQKPSRTTSVQPDVQRGFVKENFQPAQNQAGSRRVHRQQPGIRIQA